MTYPLMAAQNSKYCEKIFEKDKNVKIIKADFTKINFLQYNADCYFFNNPFNNDIIFIDLMKEIINFNKEKNILFIFINYNWKIIESIKNIHCIESYYINDIKGYAIYCLKNK